MRITLPYSFLIGPFTASSHYLLIHFIFASWISNGNYWRPSITIEWRQKSSTNRRDLMGILKIRWCKTELKATSDGHSTYALCSFNCPAWAKVRLRCSFLCYLFLVANTNRNSFLLRNRERRLVVLLVLMWRSRFVCPISDYLPSVLELCMRSPLLIDRRHQFQ